MSLLLLLSSNVLVSVFEFEPVFALASYIIFV